MAKQSTTKATTNTTNAQVINQPGPGDASKVKLLGAYTCPGNGDGDKRGVRTGLRLTHWLNECLGAVAQGKCSNDAADLTAAMHREFPYRKGIQTIAQYVSYHNTSPSKTPDGYQGVHGQGRVTDAQGNVCNLGEVKLTGVGGGSGSRKLVASKGAKALGLTPSKPTKGK